MRLTGDGSPYPSDTCAKKVGRSVPLSRCLVLVPFGCEPVVQILLSEKSQDTHYAVARTAWEWF